MKKQLLFLLPLIGAIMAGCSSEDTITGKDELPESYVNSYLSISVIGANSAGTRAAGDEYEKSNEPYEDGTAEENNVTSVRFFFFYENGAPAMVQKMTDGNYHSYIDLDTPEDGGENHTETVEKIIETTLRLNIPDGYKNPNYVLAVINPTTDIKDLDNPTLSILKQQIRNFKVEGTTNTKLTSNNFVMSNSVYADDNKKVYGAQELTDKNFQTTNEAAEANPVRLYVERVLARLDFSLELTNGKIEKDGRIIYKLKVPEGDTGDQYDINNGTSSTQQDIYVEFLGWNITGTPTKSGLIKEINGEWTAEGLFGASSPRWTTTDFHRSFWALNPNLGDVPVYEDGAIKYNENYEFVSYENIKDASLGLPKGTVYLQENANKYSKAMTAAAPDYATKVIMAALLVDEEGKTQYLAKWLNGYYTVEGVKTAMANTLNIYKETGNGNYTKIHPTDDLKLEKAADAPHSYYAKATVDESQTWYEVNGETGEYKKIENVNAYIYTKLGYALVWETGKTYYFFDIKHLGEEGSVAHKGIVRNHIYKATITSVAGLGTPVYDPDEVIYPETPEKESIVSAKINILSWRVVSNDYELIW